MFSVRSPGPPDKNLRPLMLVKTLVQGGQHRCYGFPIAKPCIVREAAGYNGICGCTSSNSHKLFNFLTLQTFVGHIFGCSTLLDCQLLDAPPFYFSRLAPLYLSHSQIHFSPIHIFTP
ncbi:hypothetical protein Droror1_Dr00023987 [Drosera rotundifolia]